MGYFRKFWDGITPEWCFAMLFLIVAVFLMYCSEAVTGQTNKLLILNFAWVAMGFSFSWLMMPAAIVKRLERREAKK